MFSPLRRYDIIKFDVLFGGSDRDYALMTVVSRHAVQFRAGNRFHCYPLAAAFVDDMLQSDVVAFFRYSYP
jgi:hypothetical protein